MNTHVYGIPRQYKALTAQVISETVASKLKFLRKFRATIQFICMIDLFFDALRVEYPLDRKLKRKLFSLPYCNTHQCSLGMCILVYPMFAVDTEKFSQIYGWMGKESYGKIGTFTS